jgi:hypothetical protein
MQDKHRPLGAGQQLQSGDECQRDAFTALHDRGWVGGGSVSWSGKASGYGCSQATSTVVAGLRPRRLIILPGRAWRPANSSRARYTADAGLTGRETIV